MNDNIQITDTQERPKVFQQTQTTAEAPMITINLYKPFYDHTEEIRPRKLTHIKNTLMLDNSLNPLNNKYVKKIWVYKTTKLDRIKRDLFWEYFKDRKKKDIAETLLYAFYKNRKEATIIYFDDPVQYDVTITDEIAEELKEISREFIAFKKANTPPKIKKEKKEKKEKKVKPNKKPHYKTKEKY